MLSTYNITPQTIAADGLLSFSTNRILTGCTVKHAEGTPTIRLTKPGYYYVNVNATVSDTAAGTITLKLKDGAIDVPGAAASITVGATTDEASLGFTTIVRVLPSCCAIDNTASLTIVNSGIEATFVSATVDITKLCQEVNAMLVYKALYRKMMDDLKDAGMWIDWAEQLESSHPNVAEYLCDSAKMRLEDSFPKTYELFKELCQEKTGREAVCMDEVVHDHLMEWYHSLKTKIEKQLVWGEQKLSLFIHPNLQHC